MRKGATLALLAWALIGFPSVAQAQKVEVAPGVSVTRKTYPVPGNEAAFYNFAEKTASQKANDDHLIAEVLKLTPDRSAAAAHAIVRGWEALISQRDYATAAKRFNQAFLLDPNASLPRFSCGGREPLSGLRVCQ
jgi:hypothetical protein